MRNPLTFVLAIGTAFAATPCLAQPAAEFYRDRQMTMTVGTTAGNDYDFRARLVAKYIVRHLPGNPVIVTRNMPGGGGIIAANWLAQRAPRDGSALLMMMQALTVSQAIGVPNIHFDVRAFRWIGNTIDSPNVVNTWHTSDVRSVDDAKKREVILGATAGSYAVVYPPVMNALLGTKFKIVTGYPGGNEVNLAMERGEVQGRGANSWASWKSTKPDWIAEKKLVILTQVSLKRDPDLPDVPLLMELTSNEFDRKVLRFLSADTAISRAIVTAPEVPDDRVTLLRRAFDATMKDPDFLAEAAKTKMDIAASRGEEAQEIANSLINTEPDVLKRAKELMDATR
jgi:tripartite-type tricarboxylate transporter receptor subunit TctC